MAATVDAIRAKLQSLVDPWTGRDYVTGKEARNIRVEGDRVLVDIQLGYPAKSVMGEVRDRVAAALREVPEVGSAEVKIGRASCRERV